MKFAALTLLLVARALPAVAEMTSVEAFQTAGGANCVVSAPAKPNGKLLLVAHGFVPANRPLLAILPLGDGLHRRLLDAGWTIAATSYRRNGLILADGAADLELLRQEVVLRHGPMSMVLIEGASMGGFIAAAIAEAPPDPSYRGALALGAALDIQAPGDAARPLTAKPKFPVLFLSTRDEIAGPTDYAARAGRERTAVWQVARDGHVNLNQAEIGAAFDALARWTEGAPIEPARDGTLPAPPRPLTASFSADARTVTAHVIEVDPVYGNLTVDLRPEDADRLGWRKGDWASLRIGEAKEPVPILHGSTFGDVKEGAWVSFPTADGAMLICRNFADAAASSGARVGAPVTLTRPPTD